MGRCYAMLKMIHCDKFVENGLVRRPIVFNSGLNTILGDEVASNSIGKSTFLMILDFAFGGNDYVTRSIDVQANIGAHTIHFIFEFKDQPYYFSRSTLEPKKIHVCDEHFKPTRTMSKDDYTHFLQKQFELDLPGLTLRSAISRFFRVYGRETLDPKLPLQSAAKEGLYTGIDGLLKLFDRYRPIAAQQKLTEEAELAENSFKAAQKYNYLPYVRNGAQYKENQKRIAQLEEAIKRLVRDSSEGLVDAQTLETESLLELCQELRVAKRQYIGLMYELDSMEMDRLKRKNFQKDFTELEKFFPEINLKRIEEIEQFHMNLADVLKGSFKEKEKSLQKMIDPIVEEIAQLEMKIAEIGRAPSVSSAILSKHAEKLKDLQLLQDANANYDKKEVLKKSTKALKVQLDILILALLDQTVTEVNALMNQLNNLINGERTAPYLTIKDAKRYTFSTPNDRGTGSQVKGMILFDLAILALTNMPLLAHDSVLLKQIEDDTLEKILQLYANTEKQVFIVLDKKGSFSEEAQKILEKTAVLNLYPGGGELFGRAWNTNH